MSKWKMVKLGELFDVGSSKRVFQSEWRDSGIPFYRAREIAKLANDGYVNNELYIDEKMYLEYSKKYGIPAEGDIMVTGVGTLGVCYIVKNTDKFYFKDGNILWFKKTTDVNSSYISWVFRTNYMKEQIKKHSSGTTVGTFTISTAKEITFPLPPLEEQKRIADILDKASNLIDLRKQQLEKMNLLVKSKFIDMFGDPVTNPKRWEVNKLVEVTNKIGSGSTPRGGKESYIEEGISLIRSMNVYDGRFKYDQLAYIDEVQAKQMDIVTVFDSDVLINITGASVARSCVVPKDALPARVNQHVSIIRCICEKLNTIYLNQLFISDSYKSVLLAVGGAGGATREAITKQQLEKLDIPIPLIELQNQFAAFVEQVEKQKAVMQQSLEKMEMNYKALMQKYFE